jgi:hypothetical protein
MMTTQPAGAVNGVALTTQPVVRVTDSGNNTVTSFTGNVVASIASGTGTLSGTTTVAAVAGIATFTNLVITGTAGNFTLTFTPASLTAVTSNSFALAAGAATKVAITRASVGTTDNVAFTTQPQITIQDSGGNTDTSSNAVVTATISGVGGTLIGSTTATATSGVATFTGLGIDGNNGTTYTITYTVSGLTVATATVTLVRFCDGSSLCAVGDRGPGGGTIFYVAIGTFTSTGSACNTNGAGGISTCKYLEAAPTSGINAWSDTPSVAWSGNTSVAIGETARGTAIGTGYANTLAIVGQASGGNTADRAATKARAYTGPNNLSDWFLPSKDELIQMCRWQVARAQATCNGGGFANTGIGASGFILGGAVYWSSTEVDADQANALNFGTGVFNPNYKQTNPSYVRPIRAFGAPSIVTAGLLRQVDAGDVSTFAAGVTFAGGLTSSSGSFNFDGIDDSMDLGAISDIGSSSTEFSVEIWFKPGALEIASLIQNGSDYTTNTYYLWQQSSTELVFEVYGSSSFDAITFDSTQDYSVDTWYHLVGVWKANERLKLYRNGSANGNVPWATGQIQTAVRSGDTTTIVGQRGSGSYFDGNIPIVRLYTVALTEAQVLQNFNAQKSRFGL